MSGHCERTFLTLHEARQYFLGCCCNNFIFFFYCIIRSWTNVLIFVVISQCTSAFIRCLLLNVAFRKFCTEIWSMGVDCSHFAIYAQGYITHTAPFFYEQDEIDIDSATRTIYLRWLNKGFSSNFSESYPDQQTPEEVERAQQPKHCDTNNKDEDISPTANNLSNSSFR